MLFRSAAPQDLPRIAIVANIQEEGASCHRAAIRDNPDQFALVVVNQFESIRFKAVINLGQAPGAVEPSLGADRNICAGETIVLNPGNFNTYLWQDNSTAPIYSVTAPGTYLVTVSNEFNCKASARIIIKKLVQPPSYFLPADEKLCSDNVLKINVPGYKSAVGNLQPLHLLLA